jgi:hypothetical protein
MSREIILARHVGTLINGAYMAPAGGAAVTAPEGGALVGSSALTPTSPWWPLVAL